MTEIVMLPMALGAGALLGGIFFGGLWWTVRKSFSSGRPALWIFGSLMARTGTVLAGFYFVADGQWQRLLACLLGFAAARVTVIRLSRTMGAASFGEPEGSRAP